MPFKPEAEVSSLRIVSKDALPAGVADAAVWESLQTHRDHERGARAWDPQVWQELNRPNEGSQTRLFVYEPATKRAHLLPHVGYVGAGSTIEIGFLL